MARGVGPFRTQAGLLEAIEQLESIRSAIGEIPPGDRGGFDPELLDWLDLRQMTAVAQCVARAALERTESRGAHQREDHPGLDDDWRVHLALRRTPRGLAISRSAVTGEVIP